MSRVERLGRVKHDDLGLCVRVRLRHWEGPVESGQRGGEIWTERLVPRDQSKPMHPRHLTAFGDDGKRVFCISPSVSYFTDLVAYAQPKWGAQVRRDA